MANKPSQRNQAKVCLKSNQSTYGQEIKTTYPKEISPSLRNPELRLSQLKRRRQSDTNTGSMKKYPMIIMRHLQENSKNKNQGCRICSSPKRIDTCTYSCSDLFEHPLILNVVCKSNCMCTFYWLTISWMFYGCFGHGILSGSILWDHIVMWDHLTEHFEAGELFPFPV